MIAVDSFNAGWADAGWADAGWVDADRFIPSHSFDCDQQTKQNNIFAMYERKSMTEKWEFLVETS